MQPWGDYNREQLQTIHAVLTCLENLSPKDRKGLEERIRTYLTFREEVDRFLEAHFSEVCTRRCYSSRESACCSREGITTFFADMVINLLVSSAGQIRRIIHALGGRPGEKCVYLSDAGCLWNVKPVVCEMFLCKPARDTVFSARPHALEVWRDLRRRERRYTWPDRPVLFDELEAFFMERRCRSSLMYFHNSPGLLRVKANAAEKRQTLEGVGEHG